MSVKIAVLLATELVIFFPPFSLATIFLSHRENAGEFKETFVFKICSIILEETEWKFMSIIMSDAAEMELSEDFMMNFHDEVRQLRIICEIFSSWSPEFMVSTVTLTNSTIEPPSSRAALLIFGNTDRLFDAVSLPLPIWIPNTSYVILVRDFPSASDSVFRDLWIHHHVTNVLMIAWREPGKVQSYNPFFDRLTENQVETSGAGNATNTTSNIRKIMRNKMSNLNGHPIRVTMFPTRLKAIPLPNGTFTGYDGIILQTLAKHMNFTPLITIPPDGHKYGWKEKNGSFTGSIGEIIYGRADIAFNGVFIKHYHSDDIQFTTPVHFDQVCFVVPKASTKSKWKTVFLTFDLSIWISVWFSYWIVLIAWFVIKRTNETYFDKTLLCVNLYGIFLMMPINRIRSTLSERIIVLSSVLFAFVVASSFQGSMIKFLTYETYEQDMTKIAELAESNLPIMTASLNLKELFETDENPIMSKLLTKFLWKENNRDILGQISRRRNAAAIGRKSDMEEKIAASYVKNNQILLHIIEECPRSYHIAYLVPKMSPYIDIFNDVINYFIEAGITNSWFIHAKPFRSLTDYHTSLKQTQVVFTIENVRIAFMILVSGLVLSCFVFVSELVSKSCLKSDHLLKNT